MYQKKRKVYLSDIGRLIERSTTAVMNRLMGRTPIRLDEAEKVRDAFGLDFTIWTDADYQEEIFGRRYIEDKDKKQVDDKADME